MELQAVTQDSPSLTILPFQGIDVVKFTPTPVAVALDFTYTVNSMYVPIVF